MVFLGIYTALYDYEPQGDNELSIQEGEILYVIEKSDADDWWKAKKRATAEDEEEPVGLIPNNYVEEVSRMSSKIQCSPGEVMSSESLWKLLSSGGYLFKARDPYFETCAVTDRWWELGATNSQRQSTLRLYAAD